MKLSESMLGKPGKCVACRQKIRIPRLEDFSDNSDEIYLKDRPEFLRKAKSSRADEKISEKKARQKKPSPKGTESLPLDVLEPLRTLCSLEYKAKRQLKDFDREPETSDSVETDRAEIEGYLARINRARDLLNELLGQRQTEIDIELESIQEKIAHSKLSVRVGEIEISTYLESVSKLRRRRECLEKRLQNIRGWVAVRDPHLAGGYKEVSFDDFSEDEVRIEFGVEPDENHPALDFHIDELRQMLQEREDAERRLDELGHLEEEGGTPDKSLNELETEYKAQMKWARTAARFYRNRLAQLAADFKSDLKSLDMQLDLARQRLKSGEVNREWFNGLDRNLSGIRADISKGRDLLNRALSAATSRDVPYLRGTYLQRLANTQSKPTRDIECWIAWVSACALLLCLFVPFFGSHMPVVAWFKYTAERSAIAWTMGMLILGSVLFGAIGAVVQRDLRTILMAIASVIAVVAGALGVHEATFSMGSIGALLRDTSLFTRPGTLVFLLAVIGMGAGSIYAAISQKKSITAIIIIAAAGVASLVLICTDVFGYMLPDPRVSLPIALGRGDSQSPYYEKEISVVNKGGRTLLLGSARNTAKNVFTYSLERKIGANSWKDVTTPYVLEMHRMPPQHFNTELSNVLSTVLIRPKTEARFIYHLPPGEYRLSLTSAHFPDKAVDRSFELDDFKPVEALLPGDEQREDNDSAPSVDSEALVSEDGIEIELNGLIAVPGKEPKFLIIVRVPGQPQQRHDVSSGETFYDDWFVSEYSLVHNTATITNKDKSLILRRNEQVSLSEAF